MAKFTVRGLDLDLELTLMDGTIVTLSPVIKTDTQSIIDTIRKWTDLEGNSALKENPFEKVATELSMVYDKDREWFLSNLDPYSLNEIMVHVARVMGGAKKNEKN